MNSRKNALAVTLMGILPVSTAPILVGASPPPASIQAVMDPLLAYGWAWTLLIGSFIALVGMFHPNPVKGVILEMFGCLLVWWPLVVYGVVAATSNGVANAAVATGLSIGLGVGCLARAWQCRRILKKAARHK